MAINTGIGQKYTPKTYMTVDPFGGLSGIPAYDVKTVIIAQRLKAEIESFLFYGSGLDDFSTSGAYTGDIIKRFIIELQATGTPDKIKWSSDNGATYTENVDITGSAQILEDGVSITFSATTGHTATEKWQFHCFPEPTVAEKIVTRVGTASEAKKYFGAGSIAHRMAHIAFLNNPIMDLNIVSLDDDGSGRSAGDITISGTAGYSGNLKFYIGNEVTGIAISKDDTATEIAASMQAKIDGDINLPIRARIDETTPAKINFTAHNAGTLGDAIILNYASSIDSITASITNMTGGATDPNIQDGLDEITTVKYDVIVSSFNDDTALGKLKTHVQYVTTASMKLWAVGLYGITGNIASSKATALLINDVGHTQPYLRATWSPPYELVAAYAGQEASKTYVNESLNNKVLKGIHVPLTGSGNRFSPEEIEDLLKSRISPIGVNESEEPYIVRNVSTVATVDGEDIPVFDLNIIQSMHYTAVIISAMETRDYIGKPFGTNTLSNLRESIFVELVKLEIMGVLKNVADYKDNIIVEPSLTDFYRGDAWIPIPVAPTLQIIANLLTLKI